MPKKNGHDPIQEKMLEVLQEIRDEGRETNRRLSALETKVDAGFKALGARIDNILQGEFAQRVREHGERLAAVETRLERLSAKLGT